MLGSRLKYSLLIRRVLVLLGVCESFDLLLLAAAQATIKINAERGPRHCSNLEVEHRLCWTLASMRRSKKGFVVPYKENEAVRFR